MRLTISTLLNHTPYRRAFQHYRVTLSCRSISINSSCISNSRGRSSAHLAIDKNTLRLLTGRVFTSSLLAGALVISPLALAVPTSNNTATNPLTVNNFDNSQIAQPPATPFITPINSFQLPQVAAPTAANSIDQSSSSVDSNNSVDSNSSFDSNSSVDTNSSVSNGASNTIANPPYSLASTMQPSAQELSNANQKLLSHNAQLQRDINSLMTQVNVLANERSGQLFMYGAITVVLSLVVGFILGAFLFGRRDQW